MKTTLTKSLSLKGKVLSMVLVLTVLISIFPASDLFAWTPPANVTISKSPSTNYAYFTNQYGTPLQTGFYYVENTNEIAYCADQDATGPGGTGYALNDGGLNNNAYLDAIKRVIQNGYPFKMGGCPTVEDARYATGIAIHWLESRFVDINQGYNWTMIDTTDANGHPEALQFAKDLFNIGVNGAIVDPNVYIGVPSSWTNVGGVLQCTVQVNQNNTQYWQITTLPAGITPVGGYTFSGNVNLILQMNDPVAYAASNKTISIQGYCNYDTSNIHVFTAGGGFQTMVAVSQQSNALDPQHVDLMDATGGFAIHKVTQTLSGDIPEANATFQIFSTKYASYGDTPDAEKGTFTTDANGDGSHSGLPYGSYYLDQINAPTGVTLIPRQLVTVGTSSISNPIIYLNTLGYGHIDLTKRMNQAGVPYEPGATFRIYLKSAGSYDASPADQRDQITTDANGHAVTKNLPYGEYCMIQMSAASGMKIDPTVREYRIGMDASGNPLIDQTVYENIVNDLAMGRIEIRKTTDYTVDQPEAGAEFQIFPIKYASYTDAVTAGAATAVITTDATGYAISPFLPFDRYVIIQSKAPAGTIPGFGFFVWIGAVDQAVEHVDLVNQTYWGTIRVQKYTVSPSDPAHVQTPEAGATFRVYPSSYASYAIALLSDPNAADKCDVFTTGADGRGQTTHQLPYGTYTVEQIDNAATTNTTKVDPWQVTIGAVQNGVYSYVRENPLYEQYLRIVKTDADTGVAIPIAGAGFEILDASDNVLADRFGKSVFYTDATGTVDLSTLPLLNGAYGIRETIAPTGYALSGNIVHFTVAKTDHGTSLVTVEAGKDIRTVSFSDNQVTCRLEIEKQGETLVSAVKSDSGYKDYDGNSLSAYAFGYEQRGMNGASFGIYVGSSDILDASGNIKKIDLTGDGIAETSLTAGTFLGTITTKAVTQGDGSIKYIASMGDLPLSANGKAQYVAKESEAPTGQTISPENIVFDFTYSDQTITQIADLKTLQDTKQDLSITVQKVKEAGVWNTARQAFDWPTVGAKGILFGIYTAWDIKDTSGNILVPAGSLVDLMLTDGTGNAKSSADLPFGLYYAKELNVTEDVIIDRDTTYPVVANPSADQTQAVVSVPVNAGRPILNKEIAGVLEIHKIAGDTKLPLMGVEFEVYNSSGNLVDKLVTDANGEASTKVLPYGDYTLVETKTSNGYALGENTKFSINVQPEDGDDYTYVDLNLVNMKMAQVEIYKVTGDGSTTSMNGVVFGVYDKKTKAELARIVTDDTGYGSIYMKPGDYYLEEISTWPGFSLLSEQIPVSAEWTGIYKFNLSNVPTTTRSQKTSKSGVALEGCGFSIKDEESGKLIDMYYDSAKGEYVALVSDKIKAPAGASIITVAYSGKDGTMTLRGLIAGKKYTIFETVAPAGYYNDSTPVTITAPAKTDVLGTTRFEDTAIVLKTGEEDDNRMVLLGEVALVAAACGITALALIRRKRERSEQDQK